MRTKRVLKKWVKNTLIGLITIVALSVLINVNSMLENNFINNCEGEGYSRDYCTSHS